MLTNCKHVKKYLKLPVNADIIILILDRDIIFYRKEAVIMKKEYVSPELDKILFDINDIITHSLATGNESSTDNVGEHTSDASDGMIDISTDGIVINVFGIQI